MTVKNMEGTGESIKTMPNALPFPGWTRFDQLAALRAELTRVQETRAPAQGFGIAALDDRLADQGLDGAGLHEIAAATATLAPSSPVTFTSYASEFEAFEARTSAA